MAMVSPASAARRSHPVASSTSARLIEVLGEAFHDHRVARLGPLDQEAFGVLRPAGLVEPGRKGHDGGGIAVTGGSAEDRVGSVAVALVVQPLGVELHRHRVARFRGPPRPLVRLVTVTGRSQPPRQQLHRSGLASLRGGSREVDGVAVEPAPFGLLREPGPVRWITHIGDERIPHLCRYELARRVSRPY